MNYANPTSEEIRSAITTRSANFLDVIVPFDNLICQETEQADTSVTSVEFQYPGIGWLGLADFNNHSFSQLLTRVQLSISYWRRLSLWDANQLMVDNFNFCNEATANSISNQKRSNDPSYLFRLNLRAPIASPSIEEDEEEEEEDEQYLAEAIETPVRAVLSGSYSVFDDSELFPMLMDQLDEDEDITYLSYQYDDHISRLHIKFESTETTYKEIKYSAGMVVTNSEVGSSSIWIEPVVFRGDAVYANRNTLSKQRVQMKIVHRGDINRERVATIFSECANIAQVGIVQVVEAFQATINPHHALTMIQNVPEFPNRMCQILFDDWEHEENLRKADVAQAILDMAQELPLFQRAKVEQVAGQIIGLFDNYNSRIIQIAGDLDEED
jgi:hypothetical protein